MKAIIIGDSSHNTLSVIRSLGRENIPFELLLKGDDSHCNVCKSRYVSESHLCRFDNIDELESLLYDIDGGTIICTFDEAAEWIDTHEEELCQKFITPCRGKRIGKLFNKEEQCRLAEQCGFTVPISQLYRRGEDFEQLGIPYPIVFKPLQSTQGDKSDIHIIHDSSEFTDALAEDSKCNEFILQEYIEKEYELDCIGLVGDDGIVYVAGAVRKIRHYPNLIGAGAYGKFIPKSNLDIDFVGLKKFLQESNYHGPFSVEFLHTKEGRNFFMEVNFRNEGLAQVATDAGANLHALYVDSSLKYDANKVKSIYMMNYSIDYLHVKEGRISRWQWILDLIRTRSFINLSFKDLKPVIDYYKRKFLS